MKKEDIKVSIIVPVYNVEEYLERCLNSIINQTFKDFEIIVVNDGSTDRSLDILKGFSKQDNRIKIINNKNKGVSYSRNCGIQASKGNFLMFVDSDDWIESTFIEVMYNKAINENCDLVMCSYVREFKEHSKIKDFNIENEIDYENEQVKYKVLRKLIGPVAEELSNPQDLDSLGTVWAKIYRSSIIKDNNIEFIDLDKIGSAEDTLFNIYIANEIKKTIILNKPLYHYWRDNTQSITSKYNPRLKEQRKVFFSYIKEFIAKNRLEDMFEEALNNRICISLLGLGLVECSKNNNSSMISRISNIKKIQNDKYIRDAYKELKLKYFPIHWRIFYFLNKYRSAIGAYSMLSTIEFLRTRI